MEKLTKLAMPDVKSGTPQEKMNAVKKALQSLEMMTEAYNQIVPVINAKIDWLAEAEKVAKDDTQDKKIDELIAVNKVLLGRINSLEGKNDELSRTQNALDKAIKAIKIPKAPNIEPLLKRINTLEDKPQHTYNDEALKGRIKALENAPALPVIEKYDDSAILGRLSEFDKLIVSLDKRVDYLKRTYSEKWQQAEFERTKFEQSVSRKIDEIETPKEVDLSGIERRIDELEAVELVGYDDSEIKASISEIKKSIPEKYNDKPIKKSISDIKKAIPQPINLDGIESRIKKLEEKPNYFYNDKPVLKEIDNIKKELSDVKKSFNEIFE